MQVSVETTSELSRKMTVQVPENTIQEQVSKRLRSMSGKVKIDGFRPGKAPLSLLQKRFGQGVREEVLAELIQSSFHDGIRGENLKPVASPTITHLESIEGQGLKYTADFEVMPELVLFPLEAMEVNRFVSEVTEEDLDGMVLRLREQRKSWQAVERPAAAGDRVIVHFQAKVDGEDLTNGKVEKLPVILGAGQSIPGLEEQLLGVIADAQLEFDSVFPQDHSAEKLAGKTARVSLEVVKVEESVLPELNADFLALFGIENGDLEAFRSDIKLSMEREMKRGLDARTKSSVMDELLRRNVELSLPKALVSDEINHLVSPYKEEAKKRQQPFDEEDAKQRLEPAARRRVALGLLINRVIENNHISLDHKRVRATIEDWASSYEDPEQVVNWYYSNREQLEQMQSLVMEDQMVEFILEKAKVSEQHTAFKDVTQQDSKTEQA
ncbi:MAG: trigger factor [Methylococcaceae bacterium]|nr:trigger factor [Methylococcaceae bacterium]